MSLLKKKKLKKFVKVSFLKCPECGKLYPSLFGRPINDNTVEWQCYRCDFKTTSFEDWQEEERKVLAFRCPKCGDYIENTSDNKNWFGVLKEILCPKCLIPAGINGKHAQEQEKITR